MHTSRHPLTDIFRLSGQKNTNDSQTKNTDTTVGQTLSIHNVCDEGHTYKTPSLPQKEGIGIKLTF